MFSCVDAVAAIIVDVFFRLRGGRGKS